MEIPKDKLDELLACVCASPIADVLKAAYKMGYIEGAKRAHVAHAPHEQPRPPCSVSGADHQWDVSFVGQQPGSVRVCRDCGVEEL